MLGRPTGPRRLASAALLAVVCGSPAAAAEKPLRQTIDAEIQAAWKQKKVAPPGGPTTRPSSAAFTSTSSGPSPPRRGDAVPQRYRRRKAREADRPAARRPALRRRTRPTSGTSTLFGRHPAKRRAIRKRDGFKKWLADKFAKNEPYDRWVRDLLLAEQDGSEMFYVQFRGQPEDAAVAVSRIFLGTQLQCARCHDHPFESWTQRDFFGMAGFFVRLVVARQRRRPAAEVHDRREEHRRSAVHRRGQGAEARTEGRADQAEVPRRRRAGRTAAAEGLQGAGPQGRQDAAQAALLAQGEAGRVGRRRRTTPIFARAVANRVWAQFMGRGLVHPVDDLGEKNAAEPSRTVRSPGRHSLMAHQFDLKWYIRELVNSETYQLGRAGPSTEALPDWFERGRVRPLSPRSCWPRSARRPAATPAARPRPIADDADGSISCATSASRPTARASSRAAWPSTCSSTTASKFVA